MSFYEKPSLFCKTKGFLIYFKKYRRPISVFRLLNYVLWCSMWDTVWHCLNNTILNCGSLTMKQWMIASYCVTISKYMTNSSIKQQVRNIFLFLFFLSSDWLSSLIIMTKRKILYMIVIKIGVFNLERIILK